MDLPRTPKRAKHEDDKPEKQTASGYVTYLSPKGGCTTGSRPQFEIHLQNSNNSVLKAKGFGDDNYDKLLPFNKDKSPVKMQLFTSTKYPTPTCGYNSNIRKASKVDVPYEWNEKLMVKNEFDLKVSNDATIQSILSEDDGSKFYTVSGKLYKGNAAEKRVQGKRVKEDNVIFQQNANIKLTLWTNFIDEVEDGLFYTFSHLKLNEFNGRHLATSYWTTITAAEPDESIIVPENFAINEDIDSIQVEAFGIVSKPDTFSGCGTCKDKIVESNIRPKAYTCNTCGGSHPIDTLLQDLFEIDFEVIYAKKESISLTLTKDVASTVFDLTGAQEVTTLAQEVADDLFSLVGQTIHYNIRNHRIHSITGKSD